MFNLPVRKTEKQTKRKKVKSNKINSTNDYNAIELNHHSCLIQQYMYDKLSDGNR